MLLFVGLGNPGSEYSNTRHNVGFMAVDVICDCHNFFLKEQKKFKAHIATGNISDKKIIFAKPDTYMNLSGESISLICNYYNIKTENVIVFHDELDIPFGKIKYKQGGGSAGHNGLKSLDKYITNNYHRIRIGIGRPQHSNVSGYVLSNFSQDEKSELDKILDKIKTSFQQLIEKDFKAIL